MFKIQVQFQISKLVQIFQKLGCFNPPTFNTHNLNIIHPKCMTLKLRSSLLIYQQLLLRSFSQIIPFSTCKNVFLQTDPIGLACTKIAISWVPFIQMRCTLYQIKLDSKCNNFHSLHFSIRETYHSQNRAQK